MPDFHKQFPYGLVTAAAILLSFGVPVQAQSQGEGEAFVVGGGGAFESAVSFGVEQPKEATVQAVWVAKSAKGSRGGTSKVMVRVEPNPEGLAPVSLGGDYVESLGATWRAASWLAAFCATNAMGELITNHHILVRVGGQIDGPSAGMLLTATMMALLNGDAIRPDVTITGAVNPDGTVGPVGGVPEKIIGAAEAGIRMFGYPVMNRYYRDPATDEIADLEETHSKYGVRLVEISDVFDAYYLVTGRPIGRPEPIHESELRLTAGLALKVRRVSDQLRDEVAEQIELARQHVKRLEVEVNNPTLEAAKELAERSVELELSGSLAEALYLAIQAHQQAYKGWATQRVQMPLLMERKSEAVEEFEEIRTEAIGALKDLREQASNDLQRPHLGGKLDAINAYLQYWECESYRQTGGAKDSEIIALQEQARTADGAKAEEVQKLIQDKMVTGSEIWGRALSRSKASFLWASQTRENLGVEIRVPEGVYQQLAKAYSAAAVASVSYFNAIYLGPAAEKISLSMDAMKSRYETIDVNYALLSNASKMSKRFGSLMLHGDDVGDETTIDLLGSSMYAFVGVYDYINRHYTYGGRELPDGTTELSNRHSLGKALDLARHRVLEQCTLVKEEAGFIPDSILINYAVATAMRDSASDEGRLAALRIYWRCYFLCSFTRLLASPEFR